MGIEGSGRRGRAGVVALATIVGVLAGTASAAANVASERVHDHCDGVDHPPFSRQYEGDGFSFLLFGFAFVPDADGQPPQDATLSVTGPQLDTTVDLEIDELGKAEEAIGIFQFGDYEWVVDSAGGQLISGTTTVSDPDQPCDKSMVETAPQPEPSQEPTQDASSEPATQEPTQEPSAESTEPSPVASEPAVDTGGGSFPWPVVILGGGLLALVGWFLAKQKDDCPEEVKALDAARKACEEARRKAREARDEADTEQAELDEIRAQLDAIRETFPDAGRPGGDSWVESEGRRITSQDVRMKRAAMRAAWDHYQSNPNASSAQETMEAWEQFDTPEFRDKLRELDEFAKDLVKDLEKARGEAEAADRAADAAERAADEACRKVDEAQAALDECMKRRNPPPTPAPTPGGTAGGTTGGTDGGPSGPASGGGGGPQEPRRECDPDGATDERNVRRQRFNIPIGLRTDITGCEAHRSAEEARVKAEDLIVIGTALGWVSTAMTLGEGGVMQFREGGWHAASAGANTAYTQLSGAPLPTNPIQAGVDVLAVTAQLTGRLLDAFADLHEARLNDCELRIGLRYEAFEVACADLYRCENGSWVSKGKQVTVTKLRSYNTGQKLYQNITWPNVQSIINGYGQRMGAQMRAQMEAMHRAAADCAGS